LIKKGGLFPFFEFIIARLDLAIQIFGIGQLCEWFYGMLDHMDLDAIVPH